MSAYGNLFLIVMEIENSEQYPLPSREPIIQNFFVNPTFGVYTCF